MLIICIKFLPSRDIKGALENYFIASGENPRNGDYIYTDELGICNFNKAVAITMKLVASSGMSTGRKIFKEKKREKNV